MNYPAASRHFPAVLSAALVLLVGLPAAPAANDLTVLARSATGSGPDGMMNSYLLRLAYEALDRRNAEYEKIKTPEQVAAWQRGRREAFLAALGGFPERTPLNARVTGRLDFPDYRVEKIIFESQPGFHVTGNLYLPLTPGPHPVVVHPTGHSPTAKARDLYQRASIVMAKNGVACFCYDPVGQGERRHFFEADGKITFTGTTQEHNLMGVGSTLLGTSVARYMIWDGMRAIDYLQGRPDIDPKRIGAMGISGGGTMSAYLAALDERVAAAAPGCYLTGFRRLLETIGPQDAEQNLFGQIAGGLDHGDFVMMRAPKPTLIMAATRDYFDIDGAWHLFRQSKRLYTRLGMAERVDLIEPDEPHGFPTEMRVGATRWMRRWFLGSDEPVTEKDFPVMTDAQLQCTPDGQVLRLPGALSLFDLNREWEERLATGRRALWRDPAVALGDVRKVTGIRRLAELPAPTVKPGPAFQREGYSFRHVVIEPEPGIQLPALRFEPASGPARGDAVLYLHGDGKHVDAAPGGPIERLVREGRTVLAVDLRGLGETGRAPARDLAGTLLGGLTRDVSLAELLGRSFVSMRAEDLLACVRYLNAPGSDVRPSAKVALLARGEAGVPALHAAALEPQAFSSVRLERTVASWADVVRTPLARNQRINTVFGALRVYDLPDLASALPRGLLTVVEPADAVGR
jgi:dienelactone hydrolase